ncbi:hypothetical protein BGX26_004097, partial [Mortierella sp. AD094]
MVHRFTSSIHCTEHATIADEDKLLWLLCPFIKCPTSVDYTWSTSRNNSLDMPSSTNQTRFSRDD